MKKRFYNYIAFLVMLIFLAACQSADKKELKGNKSLWPISSYNFGGLEKLSAEAQVSLLRESGYQGITLRIAKNLDFKMLPDFISEADKYDDFRINALFVRYNFDDPVDRRESWTEVVNQIAGKNIQLWVIFGKKIEAYDDVFVENKLREIVEYSTPKEVEVILYPHSDCYFESAEEGIPFVEKIDHDNLKIAFHLYHEIRAKNGTRIDEVLDGIKHKLGAITLAGSDSVADYSSSRTRDTTTIKPLGRGTFDVKELVLKLEETAYSGYIGLMNFQLKEAPENYLPKSRNIWDSYFDE